MASASRPVVIIGAGLAGLACAAELTAAQIDTLVVEASDEVGGRVRTDQVDGFLLDRGFQVLLTAYPELGRRVDLAELELGVFEPGATVLRGSRTDVVADPFRAPRSLPATIRSALPGGIANPGDLLRLWTLRRRLSATPPNVLLRGSDVRTSESLPIMGFSPKFIRSFLAPFVGGVQLDPALSTSVRMFDVIMRMLLEGSVGLPARGMGEIPAAISRTLPDDSIRLNERVLEIRGNQVRTENGLIDAHRIVVATEGPTASALLDLPQPGSRPVGCLWFDIPAPPVTGRRIILAGDSTGPVLNAAVVSEVAPTYAPPGRHLIGLATPGDIGNDLEARALAQAREWWGDQVDSWCHLRTDRIAHGQPDQSPPFAPRRRVQIADHLFVCGDHRDTGSIQGALFSGRRCALSVIDSLAG